MKVLSLFDGISCARVALEQLGVKPEYYASEIDVYAIQIAQKNWPDTVQISDVTAVRGADYPDLDLLIGGSPCQDLSVAKHGRKGLAGDRSKLFYEYLRIRNEAKPKWWVLENVASMSKENKDKISALLGVQPIMIDASLVSAQSRKRLFWTNIPVTSPPVDRGITMKDILVDGYAKDEKSRTITASYSKGAYVGNLGTHRERTMVFTKPIRLGQLHGTKGGQAARIYSIDGKSVTLSALGGGGGGKTGLYDIKGLVRDLYPIECERLQSLPDEYTQGISNTQRKVVLGNAFNVEVIKHILQGIVPKKD